LIDAGFFVVFSEILSIIAQRINQIRLSMLIPPANCLTVANHRQVYAGDHVLVEVFYPDAGRSLRLGILSCAGSLGWSVTTMDGIHLIVIVDADPFFDDTVQPHQIYSLTRTKEGKQ